MARSHGVLKVGVWAPDSEFRSLSKDAQRAYVMLLSQPQINNCGVLPYTPDRWARYAPNDTPAQMRKALRELVAARFVLIDEATHELLVRTFIRHDRVERQPNVKKAAQKEFQGSVESAALRGVLEVLHPWLAEPLGEGPVEPPDEPPAEPLTEGVGEGVNARTRAAPSITTTSTKEKEQKSPKGDSATKVAYRLFSHWQEVWGHPRATLTPPRRALVARRLKDGYDEATLAKAIDGSRRDDWPGRSKPLNHDFELLLRDAKHIEAFVLMAGGANGMRSESEDERESRLRREMATRGPR